MFRYIVLLCCARLLFAHTQEVETILKESQAAWNRGDLVSFASHYDDSPKTPFIGHEVVRGGVEAILARYQRAYPTREAMGTLIFSEIEVRPLADGVALATGKFLLRTAAGGGDASGRFTLILQRRLGVWKIIHDPRAKLFLG